MLCVSKVYADVDFSDIFKGIYTSQSPRLRAFITGLPTGIVDSLENDEQEAGQFVCQILQGNMPGIIEDLGDDVWDEIESSWSAVTDFIQSLPTLAPEVLEDIIQDDEDVVSVVGDIFTNPEAAVTVIVSGVEAVVSDVESVGKVILSGLECFFDSNKCSTADLAATISSSCNAILAAATTTYTPPTTSSTSYPSAQTIASKSAPTTTTTPAAAPTTSSHNGGTPATFVSANFCAWTGIVVCFLVGVAGL
jgi:hypothetical protein